ncbi:MAG: hypothetical protein QTN59_15210 [Candidatus Electrothrix communis]|nr:MAG: hypothetical protein QTN59_15210 [Candidatus Electrothrix communis]
MNAEKRSVMQEGSTGISPERLKVLKEGYQRPEIHDFILKNNNISENCSDMASSILGRGNGGGNRGGNGGGNS